jgi:hypothetical protein
VMSTPFTDGAKYEDISKVSNIFVASLSERQLTKLP